MLATWKKSYDQLRQHIKKQRHYFATEGPSSESYGVSNSHIWMWERDHKESSVLKNWCFWTAVLEKTLESPLDCSEIKPVNYKGSQSWIFMAGLMLKLKLQYFGHLMRRTDPLEKTLMLGKTEVRRKRGWQGMRRGWHHRLNGYEFEQAPGVGDGQGGLACCSPGGCRALDTSNWTELNWTMPLRRSYLWYWIYWN